MPAQKKSLARRWGVHLASERKGRRLVSRRLALPDHKLLLLLLIGTFILVGIRFIGVALLIALRLVRTLRSLTIPIVVRPIARLLVGAPLIRIAVRTLATFARLAHSRIAVPATRVAVPITHVSIAIAAAFRKVRRSHPLIRVRVVGLFPMVAGFMTFAAMAVAIAIPIVTIAIIA